MFVTIDFLLFLSFLFCMKVNNIEDGISLILSKEKPLAAYLFTNDKKLKEEFVTRVSAGGISINEVAIHVSLSFSWSYESLLKYKCMPTCNRSYDKNPT